MISIKLIQISSKYYKFLYNLLSERKQFESISHKKLPSYTDHVKFIKSMFRLNICVDFSHADDICNAIYLLIKSKANLNKIILSSNHLTNLNDIIMYLLKLPYI